MSFKAVGIKVRLVTHSGDDGGSEACNGRTDEPCTACDGAGGDEKDGGVCGVCSGTGIEGGK